MLEGTGSPDSSDPSLVGMRNADRHHQALRLLEGPELDAAIADCSEASWTDEYGITRDKWREIVTDAGQHPHDRNGKLSAAISHNSGSQHRIIRVNNASDFEPARDTNEHAVMAGFQSMEKLISPVSLLLRDEGIIDDCNPLRLGILGIGTGTIGKEIEHLNAARQVGCQVTGFTDRMYVDPSETLVRNRLEPAYRDNPAVAEALEDLLDSAILELSVSTNPKHQKLVSSLGKSLNTLKKIIPLIGSELDLPSSGAPTVTLSEIRLGDRGKPTSEALGRIVSKLRRMDALERLEQFKRWFGADLFEDDTDLDNYAVVAPQSVICAPFEKLVSGNAARAAQILASMHMVIDIRSMSHVPDEVWIAMLRTFGPHIPFFVTDGTRPSNWGRDDEYCRLDVVARAQEQLSRDMGISVIHTGANHVRSLVTQARYRAGSPRQLIDNHNLSEYLIGGFGAVTLPDAMELDRYNLDQQPYSLLLRALSKRNLSPADRAIFNRSIARHGTLEHTWEEMYSMLRECITERPDADPDIIAEGVITVFLTRHNVRALLKSVSEVRTAHSSAEMAPVT